MDKSKITSCKRSNGIFYALDNNDKHVLKGGDEDMRLICVFNPPLIGNEIHDKDGSYELRT